MIPKLYSFVKSVRKGRSDITEGPCSKSEETNSSLHMRKDWLSDGYGLCEVP